ncbi:MAG: SdpI family protein [Clostridiales bacterium]|nr:SdpI family protein [Clostridiales bacterium]
MRKLYTIMFFTILILLAGTVVFLILSPDQIPVHMSISGEVDRIGSKFEYLVFPAIGAGLGLFFFTMGKLERRKAEKSNERILLYVGIGVIALITLVGFYFMFQAGRYDSESTGRGSFSDANKLINVGMGVLLVVLGNIMPKARKNSLFGIRTSWSMSNDSVWQKTQRFGGFVCVICGLLMILLALVVPGEWNILVMLGLIAVVAVVTSVASYRYYTADKQKG